MTTLRLLGLLLQDVLRDLLRHRGQYLFAILTLASGLLLAGGGLLLVESLDHFVARIEGMALERTSRPTWGKAYSPAKYAPTKFVLPESSRSP